MSHSLITTWHVQTVSAVLSVWSVHLVSVSARDVTDWEIRRQALPTCVLTAMLTNKKCPSYRWRCVHTCRKRFPKVLVNDVCYSVYLTCFFALVWVNETSPVDQCIIFILLTLSKNVVQRTLVTLFLHVSCNMNQMTHTSFKKFL